MQFHSHSLFTCVVCCYHQIYRLINVLSLSLIRIFCSRKWCFLSVAWMGKGGGGGAFIRNGATNGGNAVFLQIYFVLFFFFLSQQKYVNSFYTFNSNLFFFLANHFRKVFNKHKNQKKKGLTFNRLILSVTKYLMLVNFLKKHQFYFLFHFGLQRLQMKL